MYAMVNLWKKYITKENPLSHYLHHFLIANLGLYIAYVSFGTITIYEVILYFFMAFSPIIDEFLYVVLHYLDDDVCRNITHLFMAGEYKETFVQLHGKRSMFNRLVLHNLIIYLALWALMYVFLMLDKSLAFYGLAGLLVHLMQDLANDEYEFKSFRHWLWPVNFILNQL